MLNWFKLFPEFAANDFYITGESYGYVWLQDAVSFGMSLEHKSVTHRFRSNLKWTLCS